MLKIIANLRLSPIILFCIISFNHSALSQAKEWKDVPPFELQNTSPRVEPDASAEAIFWDVKIEQTDRDLTEETYVRVKLFDERGAKSFSTVSVEFYDYYNLNNFRARVVQPDGTIQELKKQDSISLDVLRYGDAKIVKKSFVIPNLRAGSILEYKYQLQSNFRIENWRLTLQKNVPLREISYFVKSDIAGDTLKIMRFNVKDFEFGKTGNGFSLARMKNVPALKDESNLMPQFNLIPWLLLYYDGVESVEPEKYWKSYSKLFGNWHSEFLKSGDDLKQIARQLTEGKVSEEEKIAAIFNFCRTEIKNFSYDIENDTQRTNKAIKENWGAKEILKNKAGYDFGINNLFASITREAGFDVRVIYTGDRRSFVFATNKFAHRNLLIYSGVAVKTSKGWHFCYPSAKFIPENRLNWFSEGQEAILVGEKESTWIKIPISPPEYNKSEQKAFLKLMPDGSLEGTVRATYFGFDGTDYKLAYNKLSDAEIKESLKKSLSGRFSKFELELKSVNKSEWLKKPFEIEYKIRIFDYSQATEKRVIFRPGFFEYGKKPVFQISTRNTPIYFEKFNWDVQEIEIEIPKDFVPEAYDHSRKVSEPGIAELEINLEFDPEKNVLKYKRNYKFGENGRLLYQVNSYAPLKSLFDRISAVDADVITLKKKS
ncbi:MAG: DUF3857 and transglutaminase domain-containing protein [Pyrinomonadaceae bacterium]|nr:DUF3857 and transglutaminase domain-containing protein [Pyrinomonadaceae bacterium]